MMGSAPDSMLGGAAGSPGMDNGPSVWSNALPDRHFRKGQPGSPSPQGQHSPSSGQYSPSCVKWRGSSSSEGKCCADLEAKLRALESMFSSKCRELEEREREVADL